jgi:hypothetical protein
MNLSILQEKPQIKEIPSNIKQQRNDILSNIATSTIEFLEDSIKPKPDEKSMLQWYEYIIFKNNRLFYIGLLLLCIALLVYITYK